jgi:hypothetical protein
MGTTPLFNPNDGLTGRNGGPYLDEVQARADEVRRAQVEGRDPDLDKPGANAGIQLSTAAQMLASLNVTNNPSMDVARAQVIDKAYADSVKTDNTDALTSPVVDEVPDTSGQPTIQDLDEVTYNTEDPNAPSTEVKGEDGEPDITLVSPDSDSDSKSTSKTSSKSSK